MIPCAARRFSTQNTTWLAVGFLSSTRNGSTVLGPDPYEEIENPFAPIFRNKNKNTNVPLKFSLTKQLKQMIKQLITYETSSGEEGPEGILNTFLEEITFQLESNKLKLEMNR